MGPTANAPAAVSQLEHGKEETNMFKPPIGRLREDLRTFFFF